MRPSRTGGTQEGKDTRGQAGTIFAYKGDNNVLYWVRHGPAIDHFSIQGSPATGGPFTELDTLPGTQFNSDPDAYDGFYVYVVAEDSSGVQIGQQSNTVNMT